MARENYVARTIAAMFCIAPAVAQMLGIDIALLVGGAILVVAATAVFGGRLGPRLEARRRRLQGERNAEQEKQRLAERCEICGASVDPARDVWDAGRWWHQACYRESLR
jgi:fructose-1,6-bisphosphatase/sedoheptulose 1,7-bisphosphatase-like protein